MTALLGIDLGTSSVKTVIIEPDGRIIGFSQKDYLIDIPQTGYAEQAPAAWWNAVCTTVMDAIHQTGSRGSDIAGVGLSGQMHGLVALDINGNVLRPAIIWCDQRSTEQKSQLEALLSPEELGRYIQNPVSTGFLLLSLMWLQKYEPETYSKIWKVMLPKDYIRYLLTGQIGTDTTDASGTLAYDVVNKRWSNELLNKLGIDISLFPQVGEPWEAAGTVCSKASAETLLTTGTPVVYGGADQPMQAVGNGIIQPGTISCTIGTGGQLFAPVNLPIYDPLLRTHTFSHAVPNKWYLMGAVLNAGLSHKWLLDNIIYNRDLAQMDDRAAVVPAGAEGLMFLPYLTGERTPHMDPYARGAMLGLTLKHNDAHMVRAVLEGVAFALYDSLQLIQSLSVKTDRIVASGGGARSPIWLQIIADVFGCDIYASAMKEQSCIGAAIMAGVGCKIYDSIEAACEVVVKRNEVPVRPILANVSIYKELHVLYGEFYHVNKALFKKLSAFHSNKE
jgi:xylulokinase